MKYRKLNLEFDYPILKSFWEGSNGWEVAPMPELLSPFGVVAEDQEHGVVGAIFQFYIANTQIAIIGYVIVDPNFKENRYEVIDKLYEVAETTASFNGVKWIQTFSNLDFVNKRLEKNGYLGEDKGMTNYIKML